METKQNIAEALCTYDALQKQKPFLDQLMDRLDEFQLKTAIRLFPDVFRPLFVNERECLPEDVIEILHPRIPMTTAGQSVYDF